jgi:hypothetical protein
MTKYCLRVEGSFDSMTEAELGRVTAEDAIYKTNGELMDSEIELLSDDEPDEPSDEQVTRRGPYIPDGRSENDPSL